MITEDALQSTHKVRLLNREQVQVELLRGLVPFPNTSTEGGSPVTRGNRLAVLGESLGLSPDVPVPLGIVFRRTGFLEPFVLVRGAEKRKDELALSLEKADIAYWLTTKSKTILIPRS